MGTSGESTGGLPDEREAFLRHVERMRRFLRAHASLLVVRVAGLHDTVPYTSVCRLGEDTESAAPLEQADWPLLVPLREVTGRQISPN